MASTRLDLRQEVQHRIGDEESVLTREEEVNRWLNQAVQAIWRHWPWAFARKNTTLQTTAGVATLDMPSDYLRVTKVLNQDDEYSLRPKPDRWLQDVYVGAQNDTPVYYTDGGLTRVDKKSPPTRRLKLYPTPSKVINIGVAYLASADTMDDDDDYPPTPEDFDEAIVLKVLTWYYRKIDDFQQYESHNLDYGGELARLVEVYGVWQAEKFPIMQEDVDWHGVTQY